MLGVFFDVFEVFSKTFPISFSILGVEESVVEFGLVAISMLFIVLPYCLAGIMTMCVFDFWVRGSGSRGFLRPWRKLCMG